MGDIPQNGPDRGGDRARRAERQVELTEQWLQGSYEIPEIADKWTEGPIVGVDPPSLG